MVPDHDAGYHGANRSLPKTGAAAQPAVAAVVWLLLAGITAGSIADGAAASCVGDAASLAPAADSDGWIGAEDGQIAISIAKTKPQTRMVGQRTIRPTGLDLVAVGAS